MLNIFTQLLPLWWCLGIIIYLAVGIWIVLGIQKVQKEVNKPLGIPACIMMVVFWPLIMVMVLLVALLMGISLKWNRRK